MHAWLHDSRACLGWLWPQRPATDALGSAHQLLHLLETWLANRRFCHLLEWHWHQPMHLQHMQSSSLTASVTALAFSVIQIITDVDLWMLLVGLWMFPEHCFAVDFCSLGEVLVLVLDRAHSLEAQRLALVGIPLGHWQVVQCPNGNSNQSQPLSLKRQAPGILQNWHKTLTK